MSRVTKSTNRERSPLRLVLSGKGYPKGDSAAKFEDSRRCESKFQCFEIKVESTFSEYSSSETWQCHSRTAAAVNIVSL